MSFAYEPQPQLTPLQQRARRVAMELGEALSINPPAQPPMAPPNGAAGGPAPPAQPPAPQGALQRPPQVQPGNPLQMMPSMRTPPMEAVLQGPRGTERPVGFARGGLAVFKR